MKLLLPKVPTNIDPLGVELLNALSRSEALGCVILGGGLALQHYHQFRRSHDIDAWWSDAPSQEAKAAIQGAVEAVARAHGYATRCREWGETVSFEIVNPQSKSERLFSFQIALRDIAIDPPLESAWRPLLIETLRDNIGSKMNALVNRGAPRDFSDIYELIDAGICSAEECWELWSLKNPGADIGEAKDKALHKIAEIEARMPLAAFAQEERPRVIERRSFFKNEFLREGGTPHED